MASIRDQWFSTDPATRHKTKTARHGCPKRWLVIWRDPTGRQKTRAFERKPDAEAWRDQVATEVRRGDYIDPAAGRLRFEQLAEQWLATRMVGASTLERERLAVRGQLIPAFGDYPIGEVRPSVVRAWMVGRRTKVAASTLRLELWLLSAIFEAALDDDLIRKSPLAKVRRPPIVRHQVEPWPLDTVREVLAYPSRVAPVAWLGAGAGLRQGEAFAVGVDDIDWLRREVRVERQVLRIDNKPAFAPPKRGSVGVVPLPGELVELLAAHVAQHPPVDVTLPWVADDARPGQTRTVRLLATGRRGAALRRDEYNRGYWLPAIRAAGITPAGKHTGHHVLRHCYASYLLNEGKPLPVVQARLRHRTLEETVRTYAHLVPDAEGEHARDAIASLFRDLGLLHGCFTDASQHTGIDHHTKVR